MKRMTLSLARSLARPSGLPFVFVPSYLYGLHRQLGRKRPSNFPRKNPRAETHGKHVYTILSKIAIQIFIEQLILKTIFDSFKVQSSHVYYFNMQTFQFYFVIFRVSIFSNLGVPNVVSQLGSANYF